MAPKILGSVLKILKLGSVGKKLGSARQKVGSGVTLISMYSYQTDTSFFFWGGGGKDGYLLVMPSSLLFGEPSRAELFAKRAEPSRALGFSKPSLNRA